MATVATLAEKRVQTAVAENVVRSLHHMSFRCKDAERTRQFYEDFLGLEFSAALPTSMDVNGRQVNALQLLFRMAAGNFFSFYFVPDDPGPDVYDGVGSFDSHFAMKVSSRAEWEIAKANGKSAN